MKNTQLEALKLQIYNQLVNSAKDRIRLNNEAQKTAPNLYPIIGLVLVLLFLKQFAVFFVGILALIVSFFLKSKRQTIWSDYYAKNGNPYTCLRQHFFPDLKAERDLTVKTRAFARNRFLLKHKLNGGEMEIADKFYHQGRVNTIDTQILQVDKNCILIYIYEYKNLTMNNLYIQSQASDLIKKLDVPAACSFNYFPEIENVLNFYAEQKGEVAKFIEERETFFTKLTQFAELNFVVSIAKDETFCLLEGANLALFSDANEEVNPSEAEIEQYFEQLQQLRELIRILQELK